LIQRRRRFIRDIENLISELKACATCSMLKLSVCSIEISATPSSSQAAHRNHALIADTVEQWKAQLRSSQQLIQFKAS
jgi:hypothetical protein